jgi:hypothetical protein
MAETLMWLDIEKVRKDRNTKFTLVVTSGFIDRDYVTCW